MVKDSSSASVRKKLTLEEYFSGVMAGDIAALAQALTLIESNNLEHRRLAEALLTKLMPHIGGAIRVGISGVPGVGKSTFIEALGLYLVGQGKRVAVLAVDPSSSISGGSILGDKTRMSHLSAEPLAYIRPSPSGGTLGGVASRTRESLLVCEAAGFEVVLVETVGVGQSETMVGDMTDCFLALMLPGAGDELQGIKRGIIELVDVIAVNKADGDAKEMAERAAHEYAMALKMLSGNSSGDSEEPAVLTCSSLQGNGVEEVWRAVQHCFDNRKETGELVRRRGEQNLRWLWSIVEQQLQAAIRTDENIQTLRGNLESAVVSGTIPPEVAARQILAAFGLPQFETPENIDGSTQ